MFKKILVPLDGTADSERVLDWVKPFARLGAEIHLATVVDSHHLIEASEFANLTDAVTEWADPVPCRHPRRSAWRVPIHQREQGNGRAGARDPQGRRRSGR